MRHSGTENREKGNAIMKLKQKYSHTHTQRESTTVALGHSQRYRNHNRIESIRFVRFGLVWFGFANINHLSVEINN